MKWPDLKQISCSKREKTSCMFFSKKAQLAYELSTYFKLSAVDFPLIFRPGYLLLKMVCVNPTTSAINCCCSFHVLKPILLTTCFSSNYLKFSISQFKTRGRNLSQAEFTLPLENWNSAGQARQTSFSPYFLKPQIIAIIFYFLVCNRTRS